MQIFPCLYCGGEAHEGGYRKCNYYGLKYRPKRWNQQIETLGNYPVTDITGLGLLIRLRMLKKLSMLPIERVRAKFPTDPKNFHKVDVESLTESELISWCMSYNIEEKSSSKARKKLQSRFKKLDNTTDTYTMKLKNSHPYRCSAHDEKTPEGHRLAMQCTESLPWNEDNVYTWFGKPCQTKNCTGIIMQNKLK